MNELHSSQAKLVLLLRGTSGMFYRSASWFVNRTVTYKKVKHFMTFLAIAFVVMALPVLGLQALYYLKEGGLLPISVLDGLRALNVGWADDPNILIGLHELLKHLPLSPVLLSLAALCYFMGRRSKNHETTSEL